MGAGTVTTARLTDVGVDDRAARQHARVVAQRNLAEVAHLARRAPPPTNDLADAPNIRRRQTTTPER